MDGVGQQLDDYASQVATINQQIDGMVKGGALPQNDINYERLKAQRDGLAAKAKDLTSRTEKAGASAPDFAASVKAASKALKAPKTDMPAAAAPAPAPEKAADTTPPADFRKTAMDAIYGEFYEGKIDRAVFDQKMAEQPNDKLADVVYDTFYDGKVDREAFNKKTGTNLPEPPSLGRSLQIGTEAVGRGLADIAGSTADTVNSIVDIPGRAINTVGGLITGNDHIVPLLTSRRDNTLSGEITGKAGKDVPVSASDVIKKAGAAAEKAVGIPERKLTSGEQAASDLEETATSLGPAIAGAPAAGRALVKGVKKVPELVKTAIGTEGKNALKSVREEAGAKVGTAETTTQAAAREAEQRAAAIKAKQAEVAANQPGKAAVRADAAAATKPGAPDATLGKKGVLTKLQTEVGNVEEGKGGIAGELSAAKTVREGAEKGVEEATTAEGAAKEGADALDKTLSEQKGISAKEFGAELKKVVPQVAKRLKKQRSEASDFGGVLERAGDEPTIETGHIEKHIDDVLEKTIRNATTRTQLTTLKRELFNTVERDEKAAPKSDLVSVMKGTSKDTGEEATSKLSLKQADSLRKTLDRAIRNKIYNGDAVDEEALTVLKEVRKQLVEEAIGEHEEYGTALAKFAEHSGPLEFIQQNKLLRRVVAENPKATYEAVTKAKIVGKLIEEANGEGRDALSRLMIESPELRNAARLHFTEKLFGGPEGLRSTKSVEQLRKFLVDNEEALDNLGITKEFKDIKTAVETAQKSVADAAGTLKQSKKTLEEAAKKEADIQKRLTAKQKLRDLAQKRVGASEAERSKALESRKADTAARAEKAQTELGKKAEGATKDAATKQKAAEALKNAATDLRIASDEDLPQTTTTALKKLRDAGHIGEKEYVQARARVDDAVKKISDTKALRKKLVAIAGATVLASGLGYSAYRAFLTAVGMGTH